MIEMVLKVAEQINIPFTVGGGISSIEDVDVLLQSGADKVSINSSAVKRPELINELANKFGSQCVVVAIDAKNIDGKIAAPFKHLGQECGFKHSRSFVA